MKSLLKKSLAVAISLVIVVLMTFTASAAGRTTISFSKNKINVGESVTVTVKFSYDKTIYIAEGMLSYDASCLKLTGSSGEYNGSSGATKMLLDGKGTSLSQSFTFTALKPGACEIRVYDTVVVPADEEIYNVTGSSAVLNINDKSASSNANLKSLYISAGSLSPVFSPSVTNYSITVGANVSELTVSTKTEDSAATVSVEGSKVMKTGKNTRKVIVTAPNGTTKTYTLNITKLAGESNSSTVSDSENTSSQEQIQEYDDIVIDGKIYTIQTDISKVAAPAGFNIVSVVYNGKSYDAFQGADPSIIAFPLFCEEDQASDLFLYDNTTGSFSPLTFIAANAGTFILFDIEDQSIIPEGFTQTKRVISGHETTVYIDGEDSEYCLVYAKGPSAVLGLYVYDSLENTVQRYFGGLGSVVSSDNSVNIISKVLGDPSLRMIVICSLAAVIIVLIVLIIVLAVKRRNEKTDDDYDDYMYEDEDDLKDFAIKKS